MSEINETPVISSIDPGMRVAAWFRGCVVLLLFIGSITAFVYGNVQISHGCMDKFLGEVVITFVAVPALVVGIISGFIALGLFWNSRKGLWGALIFDLIVMVAISVGLVIWSGDSFLHGDSSFLPERLLAGSIISGVVLLFGAEMAWLMCNCRGRKTAWRELGMLAAVLVVAVIPCPVASHYLHARHVDALRQYAGTHWFVIPADAPLRVFRSSGQAEGHWDSVIFRVGDACWSVRANHDGSKGWYFLGGGKEEISGWMPADKRPALQISTEDEVRRHLKLCGVPDGNIGPDFSLKTNSPANLVYVFPSTAVGGVYEVTSFGNIKLCLSGPLAVPEK
jgi:hypothetical protein